jgi:protein-L-isoaspartate O-methyltransferase
LRRGRWPSCWTRWTFSRARWCWIWAAGLGYSAAVIARLAETVVAVEEDESLAAEAGRILSEEGVDNAIVVTGRWRRGRQNTRPMT